MTDRASTSPARAAGARVVAALVALALAACGDRGQTDVAQLAAVLSGRAERSPAGQPWRPSAAGDRFRAGDGVRTSSDGGARLRFLAGGGLRMGPSTTIHFGDAAGALAVDGELEADEDTDVQLEFGRARVAAGTRVRIRPRGDGIRFDVLVGSAVVTRDQRTLVIGPGESLDATPRAPWIEKVAAPPPAAPIPPPAEPAAAPPAARPPGTVTGDVRSLPSRVRRAGEAAFAELSPGSHRLADRAEVSVPQGGSIALARDDEHAVVAGAAELVVAPSGPDGPLVQARRGRAEVRAIAADVTVRVPGGLIVARRGRGAADPAVADLTVDRGETRVVVTAGAVDVIGDQGGEERLAAGQSSIIEGSGGLRVSARQPPRADFSLVAGVTATIHDPAPPTDVRVRFADLCPDAGVLELAQRESFRAARVMVEGRGAAIVRLGRGRHRYRVRCFEGSALGDVVVASGRLTVERDAGTRPLARQAPHNTVDADGRRYTVLYQNRLPAITFRWPSPPEATSYRLVIEPVRGQPPRASGPRRQLPLPAPSHALPAGELPEGQYQYWFEVGQTAPGARQESRRSTLTIGFDNAARSGYVQAPRPSASWSGPTVLVAGAAIEGWRVAVGATALALDRQHRFSQPAPHAEDENGIAVEFSHPTHGVHLYVRRGRPR